MLERSQQAAAVVYVERYEVREGTVQLCLILSEASESQSKATVLETGRLRADGALVGGLERASREPEGPARIAMEREEAAKIKVAEQEVAKRRRRRHLTAADCTVAKLRRPMCRGRPAAEQRRCWGRRRQRKRPGRELPSS